MNNKIIFIVAFSVFAIALSQVLSQPVYAETFQSANGNLSSQTSLHGIIIHLGSHAINLSHKGVNNSVKSKPVPLTQNDLFDSLTGTWTGTATAVFTLTDGSGATCKVVYPVTLSLVQSGVDVTGTGTSTATTGESSDPSVITCWSFDSTFPVSGTVTGPGTATGIWGDTTFSGNTLTSTDSGVDPNGFWTNTLNAVRTDTSPVANAGDDQVVKSDAKVVLDGSASTGNNITYDWEQMDGPEVILSDSTDSKPSFSVDWSSYNYQDIRKDLDFKFKLVVTDDQNVKSDDAFVNVKMCSPYAIPDSNGLCDHSRVDVRAKGENPVHLYVIYTDYDGNEFFYRGGPNYAGSFSEIGSWGNIVTTSKGWSGPYVEGTADYSTTDNSVTVLGPGPAAHGKDICLFNIFSQIDSWKIEYYPTSVSFREAANSNSVARTILHFCGIPENRPALFLEAGWDRLLTDHSNTSTTLYGLFDDLESTLPTRNFYWGQPIIAAGGISGDTVDPGEFHKITLTGTGISGTVSGTTFIRPDIGHGGWYDTTFNAPNTVANGWTVQTSFAGNQIFGPSTSGVSTFNTIKHHVSISLYTNPIGGTISKKDSFSIYGMLEDTVTHQPLGSMPITFTSDSPIHLKNVMTDSSGNYVVSQIKAPPKAGSYNIQANFAGNSLYEATKAVVTVTVLK